MMIFNRTRLLILLAAAAYVWTASIEQEFAARWSTAASASERAMGHVPYDTASYIYLEGQRVQAQDGRAAETASMMSHR